MIIFVLFKLLDFVVVFVIVGVVVVVVVIVDGVYGIDENDDGFVERIIFFDRVMFKLLDLIFVLSWEIVVLMMVVF